MKFCPSGAVWLDNMYEYLSISEVFAIGRSWLASKAQIANKDWSAITAQVKKALSKAAQA
ncbi:MAG: hypothetical protein P8R37_01325 [Opitutae bacterium]|nr:hypothetical protein [Opitutae bacterium]MDG1300214.1 hypothetical protein [Opitutae bacterium]